MAPVKLYVYDLSNGMARNMSRQLAGIQIDGIWHTSVVVHGKEVYYGQGIDISLPGKSHHGNPLQVIDMGETEIDEETFDEYINDVRSHYTAENYHLLECNCNSFTNDVCGFLTGHSIPSFIKDLPNEFLATPFGQALRPTIDAMYRRPTAASAHPTPAVTPAPVTPSSASAPTQPLNPQLASSLLQAVAAQAGSPNASTSAGGGPGPGLTSHLHISTNLASLQNLINDHKAVAILFTSTTSPSARLVEPTFEKLALGAKRNGVAFVKVDKETGKGQEVFEKYQIKETPTFLFFKEGKQVGEVKGTHSGVLKMEVNNLLASAFPPHPHESLALPAVKSISLDPILYTTPPASYSAPLARLDATVTSLASTKSQLIVAVKTLKTSFVPWLGRRFPGGKDSDSKAKAKSPAASPVTPTVFEAWTSMTRALFSALSPADLFALVDLWRVAILDERVLTYSKAKSSPADLIFTHVVQLLEAESTTSPVPRALLLTTLRLAANASTSFSPNSTSVTQLIIPTLLHPDAAVRSAAASVAFNIGAVRAVPLRADYWAEVERRESRSEGADVESVCAVLEALEREGESEDVVHRLAASLALSLYLSPSYDSELAPLLEVLQAKEKVLAKLGGGSGGFGESGVKKEEVRKMLEEVGRLCP